VQHTNCSLPAFEIPGACSSDSNSATRKKKKPSAKNIVLSGGTDAAPEACETKVEDDLINQ
jgi:hypothetical protein